MLFVIEAHINTYALFSLSRHQCTDTIFGLYPHRQLKLSRFVFFSIKTISCKLGLGYINNTNMFDWNQLLQNSSTNKTFMYT